VTTHTEIGADGFDSNELPIPQTDTVEEEND
jgi:hypothetical protein